MEILLQDNQFYRIQNKRCSESSFPFKKSSNICLYYVSSPLRLLSSVNSLSSRAKKNRRFFLENVYWILDIGWWIVDWIGFKYPQVSHRLRSPAWYWMILDDIGWLVLQRLKFFVRFLRSVIDCATQHDIGSHLLSIPCLSRNHPNVPQIEYSYVQEKICQKKSSSFFLPPTIIQTFV